MYPIRSVRIGWQKYLANSEKVAQADKESFLLLEFRKGNITDIQCALDTLLRMLKAYYGKEVILLVDEYDVPLAKASDNGYYKKMLNVIKMFLGMTWKSNPNLKFAVVTGCLRIAKESIFTGANNFISNSISGPSYKDYFGFNEAEVNELLETAGLEEALPEMKRWYDGYIFGDKEIYCPWDVINHVRVLPISFLRRSVILITRKISTTQWWLECSWVLVIRFRRMQSKVWGGRILL